jgi:DNA-directed RNA polymerase subunit RPC12/RpoP
MAEGVRFICGNCYKSIEAWSDGNPYYIDDLGAKRYAYHPDHSMLPLCVGNDKPHICLVCGKDFNVDSRLPVVKCPKCGSANIADTFNLKGKTCPYCKAGTFAVDPDFHPVS